MIADPAAAVALIVSIAVIVYAMFNVAILIVATFDWAIAALRRRRVDRRHRELLHRELLHRETERELMLIEADAVAAVQRIEIAFVAAQQALRSGQRPVRGIEELS